MPVKFVRFGIHHLMYDKSFNLNIDNSVLLYILLGHTLIHSPPVISVYW